MNVNVSRHLDTLIKRYPALGVCREGILSAYRLLETCYRQGGKLLIAGNGGSCADADHIAGELMKGFLLPRPCAALGERMKEIDPDLGARLAEKIQGGLPAIALTQHTALNTAYINDVPGGGEYMFAQQVSVLGKAGDVFLGISTSGNSKNVINAAVVAKAKDLPVIALVGKNGGKLAEVADAVICVPSQETYQIQELHLPVYHTLCLMLEEAFFGRL